MMLILLYLLNQICWLEFRMIFVIFMHLYGTVIPSITSIHFPWFKFIIRTGVSFLLNSTNIRTPLPWRPTYPWP